MGTVVKPRNKLNILYPEVKEVYFAKKVEKVGKNTFEKIEKGSLGKKNYLVIETDNIEEGHPIKVKIFQYIETDGKVLRENVKGNDIMAEVGNYKDKGGKANQAIIPMTFVLSKRDSDKWHFYTLKNAEKLNISIAIDADGDDKEDYKVSYNLEQYKYNYKDEPNIWFDGEYDWFEIERKKGLNLDDNGFSTNSNITIDEVKGLTNGRPLMKKVKAIIVHRTVSSNYPGKWMKSETKTKGAHFYIDKDGTTYQTASMKYSVAHIYSSPKQMYPEFYKVLENTNTIGIEVVGNYIDKKWENVTEEQIKSIKLLIKQIKEEYNLTDKSIYPHEKVQRKTEGEGQVVLDAINS